MLFKHPVSRNKVPSQHKATAKVKNAGQKAKEKEPEKPPHSVTSGFTFAIRLVIPVLCF